MTLRANPRVVVAAGSLGPLGLLGLLGALGLLAACDAFGDSPARESGGDPGKGSVMPDISQPPSTPSCKPCNPTLQCFDCGTGCMCMEEPIEQHRWVVPLAARGADGWRSSQQLLCASLQSITDHAIWADRHGVFTAISGTSIGVLPEVPDDDAGVIEEDRIPGEFGLRTRVFHNEGSGWSLRADLNGAVEASLTAVSASRLIVYGDAGQLGNACQLGILSGDMLDCESAPRVVSARMVSPTRAFALTEASRVLEHDGNDWASQPSAIPGARSLWADDDELIAVGGGGGVLRMVDGTWVAEKTESEHTLTAVWGRNGDDLWVGDAAGRVLHFDGTSWQEIAQLGGVTCSQHTPILRIAGAGAHVWFHTATQLARWDGSKLESFGNWSCTPLGEGQTFGTVRIEDLSVVAEDDVFIVFTDGSGGGHCGGAYAVHFDGSEFHRF